MFPPLGGGPALASPCSAARPAHNMAGGGPTAPPRGGGRNGRGDGGVRRGRPGLRGAAAALPPAGERGAGEGRGCPSLPWHPPYTPTAPLQIPSPIPFLHSPVPVLRTHPTHAHKHATARTEMHTPPSPQTHPRTHSRVALSVLSSFSLTLRESRSRPSWPPLMAHQSGFSSSKLNNEAQLRFVLLEGSSGCWVGCRRCSFTPVLWCEVCHHQRHWLLRVAVMPTRLLLDLSSSICTRAGGLTWGLGCCQASLLPVGAVWVGKALFWRSDRPAVPLSHASCLLIRSSGVLWRIWLTASMQAMAVLCSSSLMFCKLRVSADQKFECVHLSFAISSGYLEYLFPD